MSRILVVDDDIELCALLVDVLSAEGYQVESVHCGESALQYIEKKPVDLVLLDVMLPKLNGMQVAKRICQRFATPILMLTALNDEASMLDGYQAGADQYIAKPFKVPELLTRIKAIFRRVGLEKQRQSGCQSSVGFAEHLSGVPLTGTESDLLNYLMRNDGVVVSKAELQIEVLKKSSVHLTAIWICISAMFGASWLKRACRNNTSKQCAAKAIALSTLSGASRVFSSMPRSYCNT